MMTLKHGMMVLISGLLAACGGTTAANPEPTSPTAAGTASAPTTEPTPPTAPAGDAQCSTKGQWDLTLTGAGCPLPAQIVVKDGAGNSLDEGRIPAISWTLAARANADGTCNYRLEGAAGKLFRIAGDVTGQGPALSGKVQTTAEATRYQCGGEVEISGKRH